MHIEKQIIEQAKASGSILITAHKSPDGDSIGSSLALYHFLTRLGLNASICHPDPAPRYLQWLEGADQILNFEEHREEITAKFQTADLIFSLDYNDPSRLGEQMGELLTNSSAFKVMIDHHLDPAAFADLTMSDTSICSTCQLIHQLITLSGNGNLIDEQTGTALYLGIMTDTGSFRFNSVKAQTHRVVADLLDKGVKHDFIHEQIFDVNTPEKLKLRGFATSEKLVILEDLQTAYISLSEEELERFHHEKGDTEGLVNVALSILGVKIAAFFSERDGEVKISFRSKGSKHPVNKLAGTYFSGGGHANAAGGKFTGKLEDAIARFVQILPEYVS
ncbi:MAG: DHH family phosphoesterase [Bacteroidota bacterium]